MKNITKNVLAASTVLILASVAFSPVSAMGNGQGGGNGQGLGKVITAEEKATLHSMNETERQAYAQELKVKYGITTGQGTGQGKGNGQGGGQGQGQGQKGSGMDSHNPADGIANIAASDLSAVEEDLLLKQYEEEMMANELYTSFYEKYGTQVFKNIADSEAKHMIAVEALLDRYDIETPTDYDHIKDLYEELKASGALSEKDALEVGVKIEFVDIDDIITAIKATDNDDIKVIFTNIGGGSYNHLRGFVKALDNGGYETDLDYNKYLSDEELAIKGPLKYKLSEVLEADGVELPEQVNSEAMRAYKGHSEGNIQTGQGQGNGKGQQNAQNSSQYSAYKISISTKYGERINALSDEKLENLVEKIDELREEVRTSSTYSTAKKQSYNMVLAALREIALEKLGESDLDLDELFQ